MFAVIQTGGKQYKVSSAQTLLVEKLPGNPGDTITFDSVLLIGGEGAPASSAGTVVSAEIINQVQGDKVIIFKKKRRHTYRRKNGHRQLHTLLRITEISQNGAALSKAEPKAAKAAPVAAEADAAPVKKAAAKKPSAKAEGEAAPKKPAAAKKPASKKE